MSSDAERDDELDQLRSQLKEARATVRALLGGEVDAALGPEGSSPLLLRESQEALRASEQRLRAIFEGALDAMVIADDDGRCVDVNPAAASMFGLPRQELIGKSLLDFTEQGVDAAALWVAFVERGRGEGELPVRRSDGRQCRLECRATANILPGRHLAVLRDITERRDMEDRLRMVVDHTPVILFQGDTAGRITLFEGRALEALGVVPGELFGHDGLRVFADASLQLRDGTQVGLQEMMQHLLGGGSFEAVAAYRDRWFDVRVNPRRDPAGAIVGTLGIAMDITDQRELQEQVRQSQKMESIGRLAGGVAHDFNNMLSAIQGFASLMKEDLPSSDPMQEDLDQILGATERAAGLTRQLLAFGRKQILKPRLIGAGELVSEVARMMRRVIPEDIELVIQRPSGSDQIFVDPVQMEQVLVNLILNARDAMSTGGTIATHVGEVVLEAREGLARGGLPPGTYVRIDVEDTGHGMDPETQSKVFEPFFTTKDKGRGTGLGLSTAYGTVKQSGGHIEVQSAPGQGSRFSVYLPAQRLARQVVSVRPPQMRSIGGTETILVAEDDDMVRQLVSETLRRHGYDVLSARGPAEALLICEQHDGPIHLMVSDVVMPRMSGPRLAERLANSRPEMRVVFMSGYPEDELHDHEGVELLQKPFAPALLLQAVQRALEPSS